MIYILPRRKTEHMRGRDKEFSEFQKSPKIYRNSSGGPKINELRQRLTVEPVEVFRGDDYYSNRYFIYKN